MRNKIITSFFCLLLALSALAGLIMPDRYYSEREKRTLTQKPQFTMAAFLSGRFGDELEDYLTDQVPARQSASSRTAAQSASSSAFSSSARDGGGAVRASAVSTSRSDGRMSAPRAAAAASAARVGPKTGMSTPSPSVQILGLVCPAGNGFALEMAGISKFLWIF